MKNMQTDSTDVASELQALVEELCQDGSHLLPGFGDLLDSAVAKTSELTGGLSGESKATLSALENAATLLWNKTVVMKTKGSLAGAAIARLRHVAFRMATFCCGGLTKDVLSLKKQILMGMKTSRAWIDCQHYEHAGNILDLMNQMTQTLHALLLERNNQSEENKADRVAVEEGLLKILCCKAEVFTGQDRHDEALQCLTMAKEYLSKFPKEGTYLSTLCYNFGVKTYHERQYQVCSIWLRESYDLGKEGGASDKMQAKTLRLLASAYLDRNEQGCLDKAHSAVVLANTEHLHPAGLFLKLRIFLKSKETPALVKAVVKEIMDHPDTNVELCHSVIMLLRQHSIDQEECPLTSSSLIRFRNLPDYGRVLIAYLDLLLHGSVHNAKSFAREVIIAHNTDSPLDANTKKHFHVIFWEQAAQHFEDKTFSDALDWYNYSLSLFHSNGGGGVDREAKGNLPKLHRNRANCYIGLQQLPQARDALSEAKEQDSSSVHTHFLCYKLALMESDAETAKCSLQAMVDNQHVQNSEENTSLICLAAQIAMEHKGEQLAIVALTSVVTHMGDMCRVLKALRCLVRLHNVQLENQDQDANRETLKELLSHIGTASNRLLVLSDTDTENTNREKIQSEAAWFMKMAWSCALKCEDDPASMKDFFMLCYRLLSLCDQDGTSMNHKKTCVMMATAACIQIARSAPSEHDMKPLLEEGLHYVSEYKSLGNRLLDTDGVTDDTKRRAQILMLLYEFEALTKLGSTAAESVLERALVLPNPEPKLFESFAALAVDSPARQSRLSMRALKVAIHTHLQCDEPDFVRCSKDIHQLIEQCLACNEEEAFIYFKETINILDKKANGQYPQMETVWLMTKSWNIGIRHFCCGIHEEAERWCSMSMRLLPYIGSLRDTYEDEMMSVYTEILEAIERQKSTRTLEE